MIKRHCKVLLLQSLNICTLIELLYSDMHSLGTVPIPIAMEATPVHIHAAIFLSDFPIFTSLIQSQTCRIVGCHGFHVFSDKPQSLN